MADQADQTSVPWTLSPFTWRGPCLDQSCSAGQLAGCLVLMPWSGLSRRCCPHSDCLHLELYACFPRAAASKAETSNRTSESVIVPVDSLLHTISWVYAHAALGQLGYLPQQQDGNPGSLIQQACCFPVGLVTAGSTQLLPSCVSCICG